MTDANKNWYTHFLLFHKFCDMQKKKGIYVKYLKPNHNSSIYQSKIYDRKIFRISKIIATVDQKWLIMGIKEQILSIQNTIFCLNRQIEFQLNIKITHQGYNIVR